VQALQRLVLRGGYEGTLATATSSSASSSSSTNSTGGGGSGSSALSYALLSAAAGAVLPALESLDVGGHEWSADGWSALCAAVAAIKGCTNHLTQLSSILYAVLDCAGLCCAAFAKSLR
jgi:hypothetical protein